MEIDAVEVTGTVTRVWVSLYDISEWDEVVEINATRLAESHIDRDSSETILHSEDSVMEVLFS